MDDINDRRNGTSTKSEHRARRAEAEDATTATPEVFLMRIGTRDIPVTKPPKLTRQQTEQLVIAIAKRGDAKAKQAWNWVATLANLADHIKSKGRDGCLGPEMDMFWIRLYGFVTEILPFYQRAYEMLGDPDSQYVYTRCLDVRGMLSEDDMLYLEYYRHNVAHVWQEGYELGIKPRGTYKDTRHCKLIDKTLGLEELDRRLLLYMRPYNLDACSITIAWVGRLAPSLRAVREAMRVLY